MNGPKILSRKSPARAAISVMPLARATTPCALVYRRLRLIGDMNRIVTLIGRPPREGRRELGVDQETHHADRRTG